MNVHMTATPNSSNIAGYLYHDAERLLYIEFNSGRVYRYQEVAPETFREFEAAGSKGGYFNAEIKPSHACFEIPGDNIEAELARVGLVVKAGSTPKAKRKKRTPKMTLAALAERYPHLKYAVI